MTHATPRIAILLPTWNGEKFLAEQLDSLLAQTYQNFVIVIRDDGSTDGTPALIAGYAAAHPHHIHVLVSDGKNLGASGSFSCLMNYALQQKQTLGMEHALLMFCDQDDVWVPHKIAVSMQRLQALQQKHPGTPVLVHSDLRVVDEQRHLLAPSFVAYQGLEPLRNNFGRMIASNTVTGCTALLNEELVTLASPVPTEAVMHDWWLALVASAFGHIDYIDEALVEYRQHGRNTIGAREYQKEERGSFLRRVLEVRHKDILAGLGMQAQVFMRIYRPQLTSEQKWLLKVSGRLASRSNFVQKLALKYLHVSQ
ncbi:MAG: glycosyltransferase family 2 protein [Pseudomonadota bacterium]